MSKQPITEPGIRGWLIVLTVLLFGSPGSFYSYAQRTAREFDSPVVRQFTDPAHAAFDPRWPMFIFSETTGFTILACILFLVLWPLFFLRHRFFRPAFALVAIAVASLLAVRAGLAGLIPTVAQPHRASIYSHTVFWLPVALALAVYVIRSRRAQLTFRHRLLFYPVFPFFTRT